MLGCGFALKPNQYLFDLSTQQNKFDTSLVLHDSGSIFFRLIRDLGLIGILFFFKATLLISYFTIKSKSKITLFSNCTIFSLYLSNYFHNGSYYYTDIFLIILILLLVNKKIIDSNSLKNTLLSNH